MALFSFAHTSSSHRIFLASDSSLSKKSRVPLKSLFRYAEGSDSSDRGIIAVAILSKWIKSNAIFISNSFKTYLPHTFLHCLLYELNRFPLVLLFCIWNIILQSFQLSVLHLNNSFLNMLKCRQYFERV